MGLLAQVLQQLRAVFDAMGVPSDNEDLMFLTRLLQVRGPSVAQLCACCCEGWAQLALGQWSSVCSACWLTVFCLCACCCLKVDCFCSCACGGSTGISVHTNL